MDSKKEVANSPDEKTDQDFPGYPHYPAKEDIMDQRTESHRVDVDVESLSNARNLTGVSQRFAPANGEAGGAAVNNEMGGLDGTRDEIGTPQNVENDDLGMREGTEADVSDDERRALDDASFNRTTNDEDNLRSASLDNTDFDGEKLNEESFGELRTGVDLDIPEETDETETESMGQGDEENKYYSLGGDRHESNEEDPYSGPASDNA